MSLTLITGGVRSGKSARGEALAAATARPVLYVATADPADASMAERVTAHVARRPAGWTTVEAGASLAAAATTGDGECVLVDGLGTWIARALFDFALTRAEILDDAIALVAAAAQRPVIVVAEEAGLGLLPPDAAARAWLDVLGDAVQALAAAADRVELVVAGAAIQLRAGSLDAAPRLHGDALVRPDADHAVNAADGTRAAGERPAGRCIAQGPGGLRVIAVVGIGADGWAGLGEGARAAVLAAGTLVGSQRQLELVPESPARRRIWPSPIDPLVDELVAQPNGDVCVLASGDPMLHGIGATLARRLGADRLVVHPQVSAFALACARLGWPAAEVSLASAVGRPADLVASLLQPGRRIVAYVAGRSGAAHVADVLRDRGFGPSRLVVLEQLGGPGERITDSTADAWGDRHADPLHAVAIEVRAQPGALILPRTPGLPDAAYDSDGQLTKWPARAITLAALRPGPGLMLWDIGAGSGSIAIEWLRAEPQARAIAIEARPDRVERIRTNALRLGVPALEVVEGQAPDVLGELGAPDAIFVGGGTSNAGLLGACWTALGPGGRLVATAVTLEGEQVLHLARRRHGGELLRLEVSRAERIGGYEAWRPQLPLVQWSAQR